MNKRTLFLVSLGCARNQVDSELMTGQLVVNGWTLVSDPEDAAAIVINTCSFIESAADESIEAILEMAVYKKEGVCRKLVVTGCLPERYREQIRAELPEVDAFLGTGAYAEILRVIEGPVEKGICLLPDPDLIISQGANSPRELETGTAVAYLKIAEGCSRHCTYCIIPKLRGKQKSRQPGDIIAEAGRLAARGVKEVVLVAQDTTFYGRDINSAYGLADLLNGLADAHPDLWVRFLYGHPESIGPDVYAAVARHANICSYVDIPIQHAGNQVLKRMGRHYSADNLMELFDAIRQAVPDVALRTTVITGFPGETEADFEELAAFIGEVRFDHLGVFTYSDSEDLPSHKLPDHVSAQVALDRQDRLMALQLEVSRENNRRWRGQAVDVLVEANPEAGIFIGRTQLQAPEVDGLTILHANHVERGTVVRARIEDTLEYDLVGKIISAHE
ncbi:MAG: 30S ribosomal protein S12 methylthiotransferase RimO [Desulfobacterales bacterium]|nr:30S ribosomal protein S12 methylthiotransferase RimO [Desulfobacterales bacterium]